MQESSEVEKGQGPESQSQKDSSVSKQKLHSRVAREPVLRRRDKMRRHQKKV